jgi:hypothetical protein
MSAKAGRHELSASAILRLVSGRHKPSGQLKAAAPSGDCTPLNLELSGGVVASVAGRGRAVSSEHVRHPLFLWCPMCPMSDTSLEAREAISPVFYASCASRGVSDGRGVSEVRRGRPWGNGVARPARGVCVFSDISFFR